MAEAPTSTAGCYIQYGWEDVAYGTEAVSINKAFGHSQKLTVNRKANIQRVWGLGSPYASKVTAGKFEGSLTVEFILASSYFMKAVMGTVSDGGSAPYTHTYTHNTGYGVTSMTIENGIDLDTDNVYKYLGCVVNSCDISCVVGEPVRVKLDILYANETKATSGFDSSPASDSEEPMIFSECSLEIPNATTISRVQSFNLSIIKEAELIFGLGSRVGQKAVWKKTSYDFKMTVTEENDNFIEDEYGQSSGPLTATIPAGEASLELTISNGGAASAQRSLVFLMTTTYMDQDTLPQEIGNTLIHDWNGVCLGHTSIIGSDNTEACP